VKWHRAHTTWFFEVFVLERAGLPRVRPEWDFLFNSYYETLGPRHPRPLRGLLSRPSAASVDAYRAAVDDAVLRLLLTGPDKDVEAISANLEVGLHHEQQHQELILSDVLHAFFLHPHKPCYRDCAGEQNVSPGHRPSPAPLEWVDFSGGLCEIGARPGPEFRFDNEEPRHRVWLEPFALSSRAVTVDEWLAFFRDGGYRTPSLWLSQGYEWAQAQGISAPGNSLVEGDALWVFSHDGLRRASGHEPVAFLSYYEAAAVAAYLEARLPTEQEWEHAAEGAPVEGNFLDSGALRPLVANGGALPRGLYGDGWEWTQSAYLPYPGYRAAPGALGEYNGKFMINQMVLRGGSAWTPQSHIRSTYRNFWPADTRFQLTTVRLARSLERTTHVAGR
jgi:ergothioneine biosynthesis protein EgtB